MPPLLKKLSLATGTIFVASYSTFCTGSVFPSHSQQAFVIFPAATQLASYLATQTSRTESSADSAFSEGGLAPASVVPPGPALASPNFHTHRPIARTHLAATGRGRVPDGGGEQRGLPASSVTTGSELSTTTAFVPISDDTSELDPARNGESPTAGERKQPNLRAYWEILRPQNVPASFGLVAAGALVASHSATALLDLKVILTACAAASVAVGSCVLNDWFDIELDRVNKPDRPLVTGEVVPQHALGIGAAFLLAAVASASAVHPAALQATIVASVALTSAYTPVLKPIPLVKNFVAAAVIAAAIAAGGIAAGAGVTSTQAPSVLTFFVIAHREILMDATDVEGDREGGVRTLPVLVGRKLAVGFASLLLTAGVAAAGLGILSGTTGSTQPTAVALSILFVLPLYANLARVVKSDFSEETLTSAVDQAFGPLALVLGLMGVVLR